MAEKKSLPFILHVDDQPDTLRAWQEQAKRTKKVRLEVKHPQDVLDEDVLNATVILVDVKLDQWQERDSVKVIGLKPTNGLALLTILQERALELTPDQPRAFALYTGALDEVARGLVPRPHIIARAHNLEWVFDKNDGDDRARLDQLAQLAGAVLALPNPWPQESPEGARKALSKWLSLPTDDTGYDWLWQSVLECRPPLHEFAWHTHGIGVLRWMLHKILPYPCFLLDDAHLAARLRVQPVSLQHELETNRKLAKLLKPALYSGQLSGLLGRRWWRSVVESIVFNLNPLEPGNLELLHGRLKAAAPNLALFEGSFAFPVLDAQYRLKSVLAGEGDVIEVVPDDWPPFANTAWALRSDVASEPKLQAIVVPGEL
ncbi:MAG: hypothetical protein HC897_05130 [Thermoanaerobaculia bacterium]|nr:hypothetical protein [Thermoanaerobaculia bacterium]